MFSATRFGLIMKLCLAFLLWVGLPGGWLRSCFIPAGLDTACGRRGAGAVVLADSVVDRKSQYEVSVYDDNFLAPFHEVTRNFTFGGVSIIIHQEWASGGVAAVVWDAALVMCDYIRRNTHVFAGRLLLELGAGTGLAGICAAKFGASVTFTDRQLALTNLEKNVKMNLGIAEGSAVVRELDWGEPLPPNFGRHWDIVLGSDIVYAGSDLDGLRRVLHALDAGLVYLACRLRYSQDADFLHQLGDTFNLEMEHRDSSSDVSLYTLRRNRRGSDL